MLRKLKMALAVIGTFGFLYLGFSYSLGWFLGWLALFLISKARERFYGLIMSKDKTYSKGLYAQYIVFIFVVLWAAPILAFIFPDRINPFTLIATYFIDRFLLFAGNIFKKE